MTSPTSKDHLKPGEFPDEHAYYGKTDDSIPPFLLVIIFFFVLLDWIFDYWLALIVSWLIAFWVLQGIVAAIFAAVVFTLVITIITEQVYLRKGIELPWRRRFHTWDR